MATQCLFKLFRSVTDKKHSDKHHIFAPTADARCSISPKLCMVVELVVPIIKGVNHFSIQFMVFPLRGKMLIFGYWVKTILAGCLPVKKCSERRKHCVLVVVRQSQQFLPRHRTAKILSAEDGHYSYLQTQFGEDRCTQFQIIVVTDPQTHTPTNKQTNPQIGLITIHCTAAS